MDIGWKLTDGTVMTIALQSDPRSQALQRWREEENFIIIIIIIIEMEGK